LNGAPYRRRELSPGAISTFRTELYLGSMFSHLQLDRRKIENLTSKIIRDSHILKRSLTTLTLEGRMKNHSIRSLDPSQGLRVVAFLSAALSVRVLPERARFLFERVRGRRLAAIMAIGFELSLKEFDTIIQRSNHLLLLSDNGKQLLDKLNDGIGPAIINGFYLIRIHQLLEILNIGLIPLGLVFDRLSSYKAVIISLMAFSSSP
jgi:hypothetical protein